MDKKIRKEIRKPVQKAQNLLKKAEKSSTKLANYDEKVIEPKLKKLKKGKC